jgi:uncharacterized protein YlaN (UPF0358 family)
MDMNLEEISELTNRNNELIKTALINVKQIRANLTLELKTKYSDELVDTILSIDKEIAIAEKLINCTAKEGKDIFINSYPKLANDNGTLNGNGMLRFKFLIKKLGL